MSTFNLPAPQGGDNTVWNLYGIYNNLPTIAPAYGGVKVLWAANQWSSPIMGYYAGTNYTLTQDVAYAFPITFANKANISKMGATIYSNGGTLRYGIYTDDGTLLNPNKLVIDCGKVTATGTQFKTAPCVVNLSANVQYWLVYVSSDATPNVEQWTATYNCLTQMGSYLLNVAPPIAGTSMIGVYNTFSGAGTNGLPATWNTSGQTYLTGNGSALPCPPMIQ